MEKPPADRPPPPEARDDVRVVANRCPYCRDDVASAEGVVCRECLTRHHPGCWDEAGRCSSCSSRERLEAPAGARLGHPPRCSWAGCDEVGDWQRGRRAAPRFCERHARSSFRHSVFTFVLGGGALSVLGVLAILMAVEEREGKALVGAVLLGILALVIFAGLVHALDASPRAVDAAPPDAEDEATSSS
ncbi:MAG: hypothetical protein KDD82_20465 [Planctomycetes bacterium]|nr:hypothetical protein [Planctomycetota bacterium]